MSDRDSPAIRLADAGTARSTLGWWSPDDPDVPSFAAGELRTYVRRMSGADLPERRIESPSDPPSVAASALLVSEGDGVPPGDWAGAIDDALRDEPPDAFAVVPTGGTVVLGGTTHRGTLYAAYAVLRDSGVRFFAPTFPFYEGHAERVPDVPTLDLPASRRVDRPSLTYRRKYVEEGYSHTRRTLEALIDWLAKTRHNVLVVPSDYRNYGVVTWDDWRESLAPELRKRGLRLESGGHGFDSFLPEGEYAADHPDWFVEGHNVFDITADAAVGEYVDNVVAYLDARPEIDVFDVWPPDLASWPPRVIEEFGSVANAYAHVVDRVREGVEAAGLDVELEAIAYDSHVEPPDPEYAYDPSVIVDFAPIDRSYGSPLFDAEVESNAEYAALVERWRDAHDGPLGAYEYYRKYSWHSLPVLLPALIGAELPAYDDAGLDGLGIYSEPGDWITYELTHRLVAALAWDTGVDAEAWVEEYLGDRYDDGADAMAAYVDAVQRAGETLFTGFRGAYEDPDAVADALDAYRTARDALEEARGVVPDGGSAAFLVDRLLTGIEFAIADTEISRHELEDDAAGAALARERTADHIETHRFEGTVLQSDWTLDRCLPIEVPGDTRWLRDLYREEW